jgi:hypothetical protein
MGPDNPKEQASGQCLHTGWSRQYPHGYNKTLRDDDKEHVRKMQRDARNRAAGPAEKVGYPDKDQRYADIRPSSILHLTSYVELLRPVSKANRAGTRGFRAPEVLLKCSEQTGGILARTNFCTFAYPRYCFLSDRCLGGRDDSSFLPHREVPTLPVQ